MVQFGAVIFMLMSLVLWGLFFLLAWGIGQFWGLGIAVCIWLFSRWLKKGQRQLDAIEAHYNEMYDLRFQDLSSEFPEGDTFSSNQWIDFERMLFVYQCSDINMCHTRVFDLRRMDGPKWEIREHYDSLMREKKRTPVYCYPLKDDKERVTLETGEPA